MLKKRNLEFPIDELIALDKRRRELIFETQEIKHKKNNLANSISIKKKNNDDTNAELEEMRAIGRKIVSLDQEKMTIELKFRRLIMMLPNMIDKSVPIGNDETNNLIIKPEGGSKKKISFKPTCILRPGAAEVSCPNVGVPMVLPGNPKFAWLKMLKTSQRNCRFTG